MPTTRTVQAPDGSMLKIQIPDGASNAQIVAAAKKAFLVFPQTLPQQKRQQDIERQSAPVGSVGAPSGVLPATGTTETDLSKFIRENAPAVGATIATMPIGGAGAIPALTAKGGQMLIPSLGRQAFNLLSKPANVAQFSARAGAGGAAGRAFTGGTPEEIRRAGLEQAIAEPIARITLGLGAALLRPAGLAGRDEAKRLVEFARREALPLDPGTATTALVPKLISDFTKKFFTSRRRSRSQMRAITELISADPANPNAFFKKIIGDATPDQIVQTTKSVNESLLKALKGTGRAFKRKPGPLKAGRDTAEATIEAAAGARLPGEAAEMLFKDPQALLLVKKRIGVDKFQEILKSHSQSMISRAAKQTESAGIVIDGDLLIREIQANRKSLDLFYTPKVVDRLENFATFAKAHGGIPAEAAEPFITAGAGFTSAIPAVGMALDPLGIGAATVIAGETIAAMLWNPKTLMSRWLTTGAPKILGAITETVSGVPTRRILGDLAGSGLDFAGVE